ncbi:hypothetical protein [Roseateles saccharophilus]|uniref:DUF2399 domain-containing protein n=1 Tax=Roseateles saccharophilus TaxID=304 RepID=A0A4R3VF17_ROSSA|nr:hypothetical protein [Roseateles saccharophilus]MDG0833894.1 hypothetical protein [Roseateles saccharophilus]TCV02284.1 hypothetical protein EV671_100457 [Roseateles saccharophilus]
MSAWRELSANRSRRHLGAAEPVWPGSLAPLDEDEKALLLDWLRDSADTRKWQALLETAGTARIDLAGRLSDKLLSKGMATRKETFEQGRWRPALLCWVELEALQAALGLPTRSARDARRAALSARLEVLMGNELVGEAAQALAESGMATAAAEARAALLDALLGWVADGETGLRRDFALRLGHTKAVGDGEWQWLERHFDLPALGIGSFAPQLTLAGQLSLHWGQGLRLDMGVAAFITLPVASMASLENVTPPRHWWLIEGRASFEKQAARCEPGVALVWIAGRPTHAWAAAMTRLLQLAPAPAVISADADPAGIEIALSAAQPWKAAGLPWTATAMEPERLDRPGLQPLGRYDLEVLARLAERALPPELVALRDALSERGVKAEQEGWL